MKRLLTTILICLLGVTAANATAQLQRRAERAFDNDEWANAVALYGMLSRQKPDDTQAYARTIVASALTAKADTTVALDMLNTAMAHGVALDSLLEGVRQASFAARHPNLYPRFLKFVSRNNPWMVRAIDARLLRWYYQRADGPMTVTYAQRMLAGVPANVDYILTLADGYMMQGRIDEAIAAWNRALAIKPNCLGALLGLGNLLLDTGHPSQAAPLLRRAMELQPTPYVAERLAQAERR